MRHTTASDRKEEIMARLAFLASVAALTLMLTAGTTIAAGTYDPGASDTEIKIGNTAPYSGPLSTTSMGSKIMTAYAKMLNEHGGINGRKITWISYDDGYNPARTVEGVRRLVEQDQVLAIHSIPGTPTNLAVQRYLNERKIPQLFAAAGASRFHDKAHYPWTIGFIPSYHGEGVIYGRYILANLKDAKIGILRQADDYGRDFLEGIKAGLGDKATSMIVADITYEPTDPTVDSQVVSLQGSGATVFINVTTPKFAAQAIRKAADIGWHPVQFLNDVSSSIGAVLNPAGPDKAVGIISAEFIKDFHDPAWADDKGRAEFAAFMKQYAPEFDPNDKFTAEGFIEAQLITEVLRRCGDNLTRANVMKQATSIDHMPLGMLLPGITINTTGYNTIENQQLVKFDGKTWVRFGEILSGL
jgi:branched-chain amino acid transport system substrate-binding protein